MEKFMLHLALGFSWVLRKLLVEVWLSRVNNEVLWLFLGIYGLKVVGKVIKFEFGLWGTNNGSVQEVFVVY